MNKIKLRQQQTMAKGQKEGWYSEREKEGKRMEKEGKARGKQRKLKKKHVKSKAKAREKLEG